MYEFIPSFLSTFLPPFFGKGRSFGSRFRSWRNFEGSQKDLHPNRCFIYIRKLPPSTEGIVNVVERSLY